MTKSKPTLYRGAKIAKNFSLTRSEERDMEIHTPPKKDGIEFYYIINNPIIHSVLAKVHAGEITETEGLYMMVNALAGAYEMLMRSNVEYAKWLPNVEPTQLWAGGFWNSADFWK